MTGPMVYKWFDRFDEDGPSGLYDPERDGCPKKITGEVEEEIERLLEGNPTEEGDSDTHWTTDRIVGHRERELDVDFHPETVRDVLDRLQYSRTHPRRKLAPTDSEAYQKRLTAIAEVVAKVAEETSVLVEDETILIKALENCVTGVLPALQFRQVQFSIEQPVYR